jgi:hypothetical protein
VTLPAWLWGDPERVFWMRLALELAAGFWVGVAGIVGLLVFRRRERARLEEVIQAELRKQILEALMAVTRAWLAHYTAHIAAARYRATLQVGDVGDNIDAIKEAIQALTTREEEELNRLRELMTAKGMLIPDFIMDAYVRYVTAPAGTKQRHRGFRQMELAFKSYLPRMPLYLGPLWNLRFRIGTWSGWEKEKDDDNR